MGKLFGTDGIRGVVGEGLTPQLAFRTGQAVAAVLRAEKHARPLITIGKDTRISSDMLEGALTAGICSVGGDVMPLGVIPTPAVAYLTVSAGADAGIVISASHNPFMHNGIKVFNAQGYKLPDETEARVEELILAEGEIPTLRGGEIGALRRGGEEAKEAYLAHLAESVKQDLRGMRLLVDCANGAASTTAPGLFSRLGCRAEVIHCSPDGVNINEHCGSTHLEALAERMRGGGYDLGIAFDGDADRCLFVDEKGTPVDGDRVLAVCARAMQRKGTLRGNTVVATVMSNLGLHEFCTNNGIGLVCTDVGDRNVLEAMRRGGFAIGGEQSGHTIFTDFATTGDGQLSALQFLAVMAESGRTASELTADFFEYPQVLTNVAVGSARGEKERIMQSARLREEIARREQQLQGQGRILVRPSGTEALVRVMVEAKSAEVASSTASELAALIKTI